MSFFAGMLGGGKTQASQQAAAAGINAQTSVEGKPIPLIYGTTRTAPNYMWYGDFQAVQQQSSGGGGKGGPGGGGGGKGGGGSSGYLYYTSFIGALCEGQAHNIGQVWVDKNITSLSSLGLSFFDGTFAQAPWSYMTSVHADQALGYNQIAYVSAANYSLGNSPQLPNHNFEVYGLYSTSLGAIGIKDADPSLVINDFLTNAVHGAGFPAARLGDLSTYQAYCIASGLWISPAYTSQNQASSTLEEIATATNSAFVWSAGKLSIVPYGDQSVSANGYAYTAPSAPLYSLTDDDFLPNQSSGGSSSSSDAVVMVRKRPSDAYNSVKLEYLDRTSSYNPAIIEARDEASITVYGLRPASPATAHMFCDGNAARLSSQLQLQRQTIRNTYYFTLDQRYVLLDPMDIVAISDSNLGLVEQWVRITEISENEDLSLSVAAEEYLQGTGHAPLYSFESGSGFEANYNETPGNANIPVIFEPTAELSEALQVWLAVSGGVLWGGCDVYISNDAQSYKLAGRITGSCRTGELVSPLATVPQSVLGQTIDYINPLTVDLAESRGELSAASQIDMTSLATLCYVDGEYIAYQNAQLVTGHEYTLGTMVRGAYDSTISAHADGTRFTRLDNSIFKYDFTPDFIGTTIYIKFVGFNIYGGGQQSIADVQPYAYTITGATYNSPLPDITNLRTSYVASNTQLRWDEIQDFRPVMYEIRQGDNWVGAQVLGRVAHPPFSVQGNGKYWVAAYSQPLAGLQVYSPNPQDVLITGANIVTNVIATWDEEATGWTGTVTGGAAVVSGTVQTVNNGDILSEPDYLGVPNVLGYGAIASGTYEIPSGHVVNIGRVAPCQVIISWVGVGQNINDNILDVNDYLNFPDVLDSASSAAVNVYPEISVSQDGSTWGAWQKYSPGSYLGMSFKARMQLQITDVNIKAELLEFVFEVDVPDRDDHYVNLSIPSGGTTITFLPDGSATPAAFNAGPNSASIPAIQVTILDAQDGDVAVVSSVSLSSCDLQIKNAGSGVARNSNILVQGY